MALPIFLCFVLINNPSYSQEEKPKPRMGTLIKPFSEGFYAPPGIFSLSPQSGQESLLLSFYRNSGRMPDFERWSKMTQATIEAEDFDKPIIALNEQVRLQTTFENTDPKAFLVIHTQIEPDNYSAEQDVIFFPEFRSGSMLRQNIYNEKLAIVVKDLDRFQAITMNNEQASFFFNTIKGDSSNFDPQIMAELTVKPQSAIFSKAARVGKNDHYLFITELAKLTLWRSRGPNDNMAVPLWSWRADWYEIEDDNADLLQLYKGIN